MIEQFDAWLEDRAAQTVEKPAPANRKNVVHEPRFKTLVDLLGLDDSESQFAVSEEEEQLAAAYAAGLLTDEELLAMPPATATSFSDLLERMTRS